MSTDEIIQETESLIREKVRAIIIRNLSIWDAKTSVSKVIDEETEALMKVIRPALQRVND